LDSIRFNWQSDSKETDESDWKKNRHFDDIISMFREIKTDRAAGRAVALPSSLRTGTESPVASSKISERRHSKSGPDLRQIAAAWSPRMANFKPPTCTTEFNMAMRKTA
jgi:hypothetical protein